MADGNDGVRHAVRETIRAGADWIKLISSNDPVHREHDGEHTHPEFSAEGAPTAVETAHHWGRKITAHAMGRRTLGWAIDAGIDSVEHGIYLDGQLATQMVKKNVALIPTLSGYYETARPLVARRRLDRATQLLARTTSAVHQDCRPNWVQIGVGTDTLGDIVEEMEMLVACGMTNSQALTAVTRTNAQILGLDAQIGTIEPGKRADLVIVQGDPIADLSVMRHVSWVFKDGRGAKPSDINISTADETTDWTSLRIVEAH